MKQEILAGAITASLVALLGVIPPVARGQVTNAKSDNLIVPGVRVGPVRLKEPVRDLVARIGKPSKVRRQPSCKGCKRNGVPFPEEVWYYYDRLCMSVWWYDRGLDPVVAGIIVKCDRWKTAGGVGVGSYPSSILADLGQPSKNFCDTNNCYLVYFGSRIEIWAKGRSGPVHTWRLNSDIMPHNM